MARRGAAAGNLRAVPVFGGHGAALQLAPVRVAESSALQAGAGAVLPRPRRAVRGQRGGQLRGGGVRRTPRGPLRALGLLRHPGPRAAHGAQPCRSVPGGWPLRARSPELLPGRGVSSEKSAALTVGPRRSSVGALEPCVFL